MLLTYLLLGTIQSAGYCIQNPKCFGIKVLKGLSAPIALQKNADLSVLSPSEIMWVATKELPFL